MLLPVTSITAGSHKQHLATSWSVGHLIAIVCLLASHATVFSTLRVKCSLSAIALLLSTDGYCYSNDS